MHSGLKTLQEGHGRYFIYLVQKRVGRNIFKVVMHCTIIQHLYKKKQDNYITFDYILFSN